VEDAISVTIEKACKLTNLSRATIYREIKAGTLKPRKQGARTLILADELRAWIKGLPLATPQPPKQRRSTTEARAA
jgi:excisionase family DNA binding protein